MTTPADKQLLKMDGWPGGVNNRLRETESGVMREGESIPSSAFLRKAINVDLTSEGHPLRRRGYTKLDTFQDSYCHSAWATDRLNAVFLVTGGYLVAAAEIGLADDYVEANKYQNMSYCAGSSSVYMSNGSQLFEYEPMFREFRPWGVPVPPQPTLSDGIARGAEGYDSTRQVAITYVDTWGRESGASEPVIANGTGSFVVNVVWPYIPVASSMSNSIVAINVYVSQIGGEILYLVETAITATAITIYPENIGQGRECATLNMKPPLAGQLVAHFNGRIYIARNDTVRFTEPLQPHLTRPSQGLYMFPDTVTLLAPSSDGVYVGHSRGVVFIAGDDPYAVEQITVSPYAPVPGAYTRVAGEKFGVPVDELPCWWGEDGVMVVGLPGGQLRQLTRDRLAVPKHTGGAMHLRELNGMSHIVSSLRKGDDANNMGATDTVVAEVRRNDIILN